MIELNERSIKQAIGQLPQHKAAGYVWESIRWQLERPLVTNLPVHTAPDTIWQGIRAAGVVSGQKSLSKILSVAGLCLFFSALLIYPVYLSENSVHMNSGVYENRFSTVSQIKSGSSPEESRSAGIETHVNIPGRHDYIITAVKERSILSEPLIGQPETFKAENAEIPIHFLPPTDINYQENLSLDIYRNSDKRNDRKPDDCSSFHTAQTSAFLAVDYEPEFFNNSELDSPVHNFSLSSGYRHNRFTFTLGAGYTQINGSTQMNYEYRRNELIYSYNYVDSVYIDPITHITYYFTVNVDVYDSIDHSMTEKVYDRYSYLQIPASVSFELASLKNVSVRLKLSGAYHLLQENNRNYRPFTEASARLVSTTIDEQRLTADYWSIGGGLALEYKAGSRLGFNLTPGVKYNFLPVKGSNEKGMAGYGLNFGISYKITAD